MNLLDAILTIDGMLGLEEVALLYERAQQAEYPIVEIGSYRGKSTIALALGSKAGNNVPVYAIDPHEPSADGYPYGAEDRAALLANLVSMNVAGIVRVVDLPAHLAALAWNRARNTRIGVLWIDGDHDAAGTDLQRWSQFVPAGGYILMHDRHHPDVQRAADEAVKASSLTRLGDVGGIIQLQRTS